MGARNYSKNSGVSLLIPCFWFLALRVSEDLIRMSTKERPQLAHNPKLCKGSTSCNCHLLFKNEIWVQGPPGCRLGLSGVVPPHPEFRISKSQEVPYIQTIWSCQGYWSLLSPKSRPPQAAGTMRRQWKQHLIHQGWRYKVECYQHTDDILTHVDG